MDVRQARLTHGDRKLLLELRLAKHRGRARHIVTFIYDRFGNRIRPGAFFRHSQIGFTIVIDADMTQGRRRFTAAH